MVVRGRRWTSSSIDGMTIASVEFWTFDNRNIEHGRAHQPGLVMPICTAVTVVKTWESIVKTGLFIMPVVGDDISRWQSVGYYALDFGGRWNLLACTNKPYGNAAFKHFTCDLQIASKSTHD